MPRRGQFKIVRYYRNGKKRTIKKGVTLDEAKKHCGSSKSAGG